MLWITFHDVKEHIAWVALNVRPSTRTLAIGFGYFVPASSIPSDARFGRAGRRLCALTRESASGNLQLANHREFLVLGRSDADSCLHKPSMPQRLSLTAHVNEPPYEDDKLCRRGLLTTYDPYCCLPT